MCDWQGTLEPQLSIKLHLAGKTPPPLSFHCNVNLGTPLVSHMQSYWRDVAASMKPQRSQEVMVPRPSGGREPTEHESKISESDSTEA